MLQSKTNIFNVKKKKTWLVEKKKNYYFRLYYFFAYSIEQNNLLRDFNFSHHSKIKLQKSCFALTPLHLTFFGVVANLSSQTYIFVTTVPSNNKFIDTKNIIPYLLKPCVISFYLSCFLTLICFHCAENWGK